MRKEKYLMKIMKMLDLYISCSGDDNFFVLILTEIMKEGKIREER